MSYVLYRCNRCDTEVETKYRADVLEFCPEPMCSGTPKRVWDVSFARVPGGGRDYS